MDVKENLDSNTKLENFPPEQRERIKLMEADLNSLRHEEYTLIKIVPMMKNNPLRKNLFDDDAADFENVVFRLIVGKTKYVFSHLEK